MVRALDGDSEWRGGSWLWLQARGWGDFIPKKKLSQRMDKYILLVCRSAQPSLQPEPWVLIIWCISLHFPTSVVSWLTLVIRRDFSFPSFFPSLQGSTFGPTAELFISTISILIWSVWHMWCFSPRRNRSNCVLVWGRKTKCKAFRNCVLASHQFLTADIFF